MVALIWDGQLASSAPWLLGEMRSQRAVMRLHQRASPTHPRFVKVAGRVPSIFLASRHLPSSSDDETKLDICRSLEPGQNATTRDANGIREQILPKSDTGSGQLGTSFKS